MAKNLVLGPMWPKFGLTIFFFKNLAPSFTRYQNQLASYKISEKTNDPILRKLLTGEQKEGQMDKSGFIGRCPTKVERPKILSWQACLNP